MSIDKIKKLREKVETGLGVSVKRVCMEIMEYLIEQHEQKEETFNNFAEPVENEEKPSPEKLYTQEELDEAIKKAWNDGVYRTTMLFDEDMK